MKKEFQLEKIKGRWVYIKGYNKKYIVTEFGEIFSLQYKEIRKIKFSVCSKGKYGKGYLKCGLSKNNKSITVMVHQIVAENFLEKKEKSMVINHIDGDSFNNYYKNLEFMTQRENLLDANKRNNQTFLKWCFLWKIQYPNNDLSPLLYGQKEIKTFIDENNLECKYSMLLKHKENKDYRLIKIKEISSEEYYGKI
jgi:hypothetical protein